MKFLETPDPLYIEDEDEAYAWATILGKQDKIAFDTETTGLDTVKDRIKFFSFGTDKFRFCAPVRLLPVFKDVLEDESIEKIMTNAKFDMHMAANHDIIIKGPIADTVILDFLLNENRPHGLKETAKDHIGLRMASFTTVFGSSRAGKDRMVEVLGLMHDAIEDRDIKLALELLAEMGKLKVDTTISEAINKVAISRDNKLSGKGTYYTPRTLLKYARDCKLANKTTGKLGYVVDICDFMGFDIGDDDRADWSWVCDNEFISDDMHDQILDRLTALIDHDEDPIEVLTLAVADYASLDAWATYAVSEFLKEKLSEVEMHEDGELYSLLDYYYDHYEKLLNLAWEMEREGIKVDLEGCKAIVNELDDNLDDITREITRCIGKVININSSAQLREYFYSKDLKGKWTTREGKEIPNFCWSKGGKGGVPLPSTNVTAMDYLAEKGDEVAKLLLEYRKISKIREYVVKFPESCDQWGRIHCRLNIVGTVTGRWSSSGPNMQQIPSKGELGASVRNLFIADKGNTLIVADYGQLEMRIMAHYANETAMIDAISSGKDLHSVTASIAGGYDYNKIVEAKNKKDRGEPLTKEDKEFCTIRSQMKAVGFGLNYGIGGAKLGRQLGLDVKEVKARNGRVFDKCEEGDELIDTYFKIYPRVKRYIDNTKEFAKDNMFVQTIMGRYRRLPEVNSRMIGIKRKAERQAPNSVIQGSAADVTNAASVAIYLDKRLKELNVKALLQVHDELIFECPEENVEEAMEIIRDKMENTIKLSVPLEAEPGYGRSWGEAK